MRLKWLFALFLFSACLLTFFAFNEIRRADYSAITILRQLIVWTNFMHALVSACQQEGRQKGILAFCPTRIARLQFPGRAFTREQAILVYLMFILSCEAYQRGVSLLLHIVASKMTWHVIGFQLYAQYSHANKCLVNFTRYKSMLRQRSFIQHEQHVSGHAESRLCSLYCWDLSLLYLFFSYAHVSLKNCLIRRC